MNPSLIEQYLELGLRLGRLTPELVDSYYGPSEIRVRVDGEQMPDPARLLEDSERLAESIVRADLDPARMKWLRAQGDGLQTAARILYVNEAVGFLISRPWRSYESCYTEGYKLCKAFVAGDPLRFQRLLAEQLTPADLMRPSPN
jgi:hypothetical protein